MCVQPEPGRRVGGFVRCDLGLDNISRDGVSGNLLLQIPVPLPGPRLPVSLLVFRADARETAERACLAARALLSMLNRGFDKPPEEMDAARHRAVLERVLGACVCGSDARG